MRSRPDPRTTRQALTPPGRTHTRPLHRAATLDFPAGSNTGAPLTPCDLDPRLPGLSPGQNINDDEDGSATESTSESKPKTIPEETTGSGQEIDRIDNLPVPSPADIPEDMKYDPGGEGTPGIMPPTPAPVPENEKRSTDPGEDVDVVGDYVKLVDLGPLGPKDYIED